MALVTGGAGVMLVTGGAGVALVTGGADVALVTGGAGVALVTGGAGVALVVMLMHHCCYFASFRSVFRLSANSLFHEKIRQINEYSRTKSKKRVF